MTDRTLFENWKRRLRKEFPSCYPVRVLLVSPSRIPAKNGTCEADERRRFTIRIADNQPWQLTLDTLMEEWAHLLRFHLWHIDGVEHDAIYGAIFNTIKAKWHD